MPELPEVETIKRGIKPLVISKVISQVIVRNNNLRWPVSRGLAKKLISQQFIDVVRRGKYILFHCAHGSLLMHMGMSGSLKLVKQTEQLKKHDHIDICFSDGSCMRYNDPRRFGCVLWVQDDPSQHHLLSKLGVEPLTAAFNAEYLAAKVKHSNRAIKQLLMDNHVVVGIGNIYATEALFQAKIHPASCGKKLSLKQLHELVHASKKILLAAITAGGTTIRDHRQADGRLGYFQNQLLVYGRKNQACVICATTLQEIQLGQRSTVFCPVCQII
jgi:formamidopyrimidine-DNA glycosylase